MKTQVALDFFANKHEKETGRKLRKTRRRGALQLAEFLNIPHQSVYNWGDEVPRGVAFEIQVKTNNALVAEPQAESDAA